MLAGFQFAESFSHGPQGPVGSKLRLLRKANSMLYAMRHVDYEFNIIKKKKKRPILRGAFLGDYSGTRLYGREARCVFLGDIPIPE